MKTQQTKETNRRKRILIFIILGVIVFAGAWLLSRDSGTETQEEWPIVVGDYQRTVTLSGRIVPQTNRQLSFAEGGTIANVFVQEGQEVKTNDQLAQLSLRLLQAEQQKIQAEIATQKAALDELLTGARPEDITKQEASVALVELQAKHDASNLITELQEAQTSADNAITNVVDDFFVNPQSETPELVFPVYRDQKLKLSTESERRSIGIALNQLLSLSITYQENTETELQETASTVLGYLQEIRRFLTLAARALNSGDTTTNITASDFQTWSTNVSTVRTNINNAINAIQTAQQSLEQRSLNLTQAQADLTRLVNGATATSIATQEAKIAATEAQLASITAQIRNRTIYAPTSGNIADIAYEEGETVTANDVVFTIISGDMFEIEVEVPELNITDITLGDKVDITFAALPRETFTGTILSVKEITNQSSELVPFYDVRVAIDPSDKTQVLRSGLIADIEVITDSFKDSLAIPKRFTFTENGQTWVRIKKEPEIFVNTPITTGGTVDGGMVIVTSGLAPGEIIVSQE